MYLPRFMRTARSKVDAKHGLRLREPAPLDKFICAKGVRFGAQPGEIQPCGSFLHRADAVLPVATRHIVASRVADDRRTKFSNQIENVSPEPAIIRRGMPGFENAGVDAPAHMLDERTEEAPVNWGNTKISIDDYLRFVHGRNRSERINGLANRKRRSLPAEQ